MISGRIAEGDVATREQNQETMKEKKVSFYNPDTQRELRNRPRKPRKPYVRNPYIQTALNRGFTLLSLKTGATFVVLPGQYLNLTQVVSAWLGHLEITCVTTKHKKSWAASEKKSRHFLVSAFTRHLTGHRCKRKNTAVYTILDWRILGISTQLDSL